MVNNGLICNDGLYEMDFPLLGRTGSRSGCEDYDFMQPT